MGITKTTHPTYFSGEKIASIVSQSVQEAKATMEQQGLCLTTTIAEDEIGYDTAEFSFAVPVNLSFEIANMLPALEYYGNYNSTATNQYFDADGIKVGEIPRFSKCKILNLEVNINHDVGNIKIAGSIPKFLYGNNLHIAQPHDIQLFINCLAQIMNVSMDTIRQAIVRRIDITTNILTPCSVESALLTLGNIKGLKRNREWQPLTSIYWCNSKIISKASEVVVAYDKLEEMHNKKVEIPAEYTDKNVLRIEQRLKAKAIKKVLSHSITLSQLSTNNLFSTLTNNLIKKIKGMDKHEIGGVEKMKNPNITRPKDASRMYVSMAVTTFNEDMPIEYAVKMTPLNSKQRSVAKKQIEKLLMVVDEGSVVGEINKKIENLSHAIV